MSDQLRGKRHRGPQLTRQAHARRARLVAERERAHWQLCRQQAALWWVALDLGNSVPSDFARLEDWEAAYGLGKQAEAALFEQDVAIRRLRRELAAFGASDVDLAGAGGVVDRRSAGAALAEMDWWRDRVEAACVNGTWVLRRITGAPDS